jgi:hypothetical protein
MFINFFVLFISGGLEKRENTVLEDFRRADTLLEDRGRRTGQSGKGVVEYRSRYPEDAVCPFCVDNACLVAKEKGLYFPCKGFWFYGCTVYLLETKVS